MPLKLNDQDINVMWSRGLNASEMCAYKYGSNRGVGKVIVIYPKEFRAWQEKHSHDGSSVSDRHSWRTYRNLCDRGFGEIKRSGFGRIELVLYSLDFVCGRNSGAETNPPDADPAEACNSNVAKKSRTKQQQLILTKQICKSVGVDYRLEKDWWEIASYGVEKVQSTVEAMLLQIGRGRTVIKNPCGWFKVALRDDYHLDVPLSVDQNPALYERMFFLAQEKLLDLTGCIPRKKQTPHPT